MSAVSDKHIVQQPRFIFFIKIAQVFLALLILALTAFSASRLASIDGAFGFNIFCCIYTFIVCGYLIATPIWNPALWNCWAALALEACGAIFWLSAFATMASFASATSWLTKLDSTYSSYSSYYGSSSAYGDYSGVKTYLAAYKCAAAVAGLGSLIWVLFMVTLVVYSISFRRHRQNPENSNLPFDGSPVTEEGKSGHEMQTGGQY